MNEGYFTIKEPCENIITIEHSKFICNLSHIDCEEEAREFINNIKKEHSLATHWCYAFIADEKGLNQKFSDAGEPSGTAGFPMLDVLRNKKIYKAVAVVTRYFGGIKLGTGGLTRAYSGSVVECLNKAKIADMQQAQNISINVDYEAYSKLLRLINNDNIKVLDTQFENSVYVNIAVKMDVKDSFIKNLINTFNGKIDYTFKNEDYFDFG